MPCVVMETAFTILFVAGLCEGATVISKEHFYVSDHLNWFEARNRCRNWYTDLSPVLTEDDAGRIMSVRPSGSAGPAWIGLSGDWSWSYSSTPSSSGSSSSYSWSFTWFWSSGETFGFEKWAAGEPDYDYSHRCVYMQDGQWYMEDCYKKYPSFCFKPCNRELTVVQEAMTWENALVYCRSKHTDLSSLFSNYTAETVISSPGAMTDFVWTGLRFLTGGWFWVNGDPMLYSAWPNNEQAQCPDMPLRCGALSVKENLFVARPCDEELNFICY